MLNKMTKFSIATIAVLSLSSTQVIADDWTGFYLGAQAGKTWTSSDLSIDYVRTSSTRTVEHDHKNEMSSFGLYTGYNYLLSNDILIGAELAYNWAEDKDIKRGVYGSTIDYELKQKNNVNLTARVGKVINNTYLPYISMGIAQTEFEGAFSYSSGASVPAYMGTKSDNVYGWTIGTGVEMKIMDNLHARFQYNYTDYNDATLNRTNNHGGSIKTIKETIDSKSHALEFGVSYLF